MMHSSCQRCGFCQFTCCIMTEALAADSARKLVAWRSALGLNWVSLRTHQQRSPHCWDPSGEIVSAFRQLSIARKRAKPCKP